MAPPPQRIEGHRLVAIPYVDIGKATKNLFDAKAFPADPKVSFSGATSSGVAFTASAVQRGSKVEPSLKAAYATKQYAVDATYESADKITVSGSLFDIAPRLKLTGSVVLPSYADSAKAGVEYAFPYLHLKSTVGLTSSPTVDFAAATGYSSLLLGGEAGYDTAKSAISKYTLAAGYHAADHQVAATLSDKGQTLKLAYAHNITPTQTVGAELVRKLASGDTAFALGYARKLNTGAATKFRLDNTGALSIGYETRLSGGEKVVGALQLNTTDLGKPPRYGFALDLF